jgi:class 3 adenylate cyclase
VSASLVGSVVFLKIAEFARRTASEQARLRAQLEAVIAVVTAEIDPESRVVLEAADGAAIVLIDDPRAALRLAQRALTSGAAGLPLAAGLNHGALQLSGRKGAEGLTGDGIAVAANIAEFAASSRLLASRAFRDALADAAPGREAALGPAGNFTDAGLRAHEVFSPSDGGIARRRRRYSAASALVIVAFIGAGFAWRATHEPRAPFFSTFIAKYPYVGELVQRVRY